MLFWVLTLAAILVATIFAAYFSGFETGLYTLNRVRLRHRREQGDRQAAVLARIVAHPRLAITTTLVGHNLWLYVVSALTTKLCVGRWPEQAELVSAVILALPLFLLAEVIPKEVCRRAADSLPYRLAPSFALMEWLFWPASILLTGLARWLGRFLGPRAVLGALVEVPHLRYYLGLGRQTGLLSDEQGRMAENVLRLGRRTVAEVMVPLGQMEALAEDLSEEEGLASLARCRHRRMPLYRGRPENVVGVVARLELLLAEGGSWAERVQRVVRPVSRVEPRTTLLEALDRVRSQEAPVAVVEESPGEVVGLVTATDLVETILGEVEGEGRSEAARGYSAK
jgi:CBS domain containing-hemolysin-like protein